MFFELPNEGKHQLLWILFNVGPVEFKMFQLVYAVFDPTSEQKATGALQQHHGGATAALHSSPGGQVVPHVVPCCQGPRGHASLSGQANSNRRGHDQLLFLLRGRIIIL